MLLSRLLNKFWLFLIGIMEVNEYEEIDFRWNYCMVGTDTFLINIDTYCCICMVEAFTFNVKYIDETLSWMEHDFQVWFPGQILLFKEIYWDVCVKTFSQSSLSSVFVLMLFSVMAERRSLKWLMYATFTW